MDPRLDSEDCMVDVPESQGLGTSEDPTGLEAALCNSSLDVCKDVLQGQGGDKPLADKEGRMEDDLVDYKSNPYELAMHNQVVAVDSIFYVQSHNQDRNTP